MKVKNHPTLVHHWFIVIHPTLAITYNLQFWVLNNFKIEEPLILIFKG